MVQTKHSQGIKSNIITNALVRETELETKNDLELL